MLLRDLKVLRLDDCADSELRRRQDLMLRKLKLLQLLILDRLTGVMLLDDGLMRLQKLMMLLLLMVVLVRILDDLEGLVLGGVLQRRKLRRLFGRRLKQVLLLLHLDQILKLIRRLVRRFVFLGFGLLFGERSLGERSLGERNGDGLSLKLLYKLTVGVEMAF